MSTTFGLQVKNVVVNQAALHFRMKNVTPSNNWLDTAKRIGYFPALTAYLKELDQVRLMLGGKAKDHKALATALDKVRSNGMLPIVGKRRFPMKGNSVSLEQYVQTLDQAGIKLPPKEKSPIQKTSKPKRVSE